MIQVSKPSIDVLRFIQSRGDQGATEEEILEAFPLVIGLRAFCRSELRHFGRIRDSGQKRWTTWGKAAVWIATGKALDA